MDINPVLFYAFAGLAIACALLVVLKKSAIASALNLVLVFFSFAAIYAMLDAHLIAALQVIVYAGAIMVLFIFVIMLLGIDRASFDYGKSRPAVVGTAILAGSALVGLFVYAFQKTALPTAIGAHSAEKIAAAGGNTQVLSELMFSEYILPFELTSVLLLAAMVGAVAIAKRNPPGAGKGGAK